MRGAFSFLAGAILALTATLPIGPASAASSAACPEGRAPYPVFYTDRAMFAGAIAAEEHRARAGTKLSGITVPHHLVAAHLVARGFRAASGARYKRIILLTPDHFFRAGRPVATTGRDFETVFGPVSTDGEAVARLLAEGELVEESCLFGVEHGIRSLLPFVRHHFPEAQLVPVAISIKAQRADWDRLAALLAPLADEETLVVQSTDFSHYLPHAVARQFDQQTLNQIAAGSLDGLARLDQPDHLDSAGAMYVQMKLQRQAFGAAPMVIASENQQQYSSIHIEETTSYLVALFGRFDDRFDYAAEDADVFYFAGDTHFGRAMTLALSDADAAERIEAAILALTRGRPLVVNLEGVILPNVPEALEHLQIAMPQELAIDRLKRLNVAAVGLANNHVMDLGPSGFAETVTALEADGIPYFGQGERFDLGPLTIIGLTDLDSNGPPYVDLITPKLIDRLVVEDATRPVVAFVHWGREYVAAPAAREGFLAEEMRLAGVSAIVGAHTHVASAGLVALGGGETIEAYSLGNFLFDQTAETSSGALLELRVFGQGTFFARLIPLPNLFDLARR